MAFQGPCILLAHPYSTGSLCAFVSASTGDTLALPVNKMPAVTSSIAHPPILEIRADFRKFARMRSSL
eukprot:8581333-Pyramimonas_sp.AAC.1